MSPKPHRALKNLSRLRITAQGLQHVELDGHTIRGELSVVAEDLFRVRLTRKTVRKAAPSWAVIHQSWPAVPVQSRASHKRIQLATPSGALHFSGETGRLVLLNGSGNRLLRSVPGQTGFRGAEALAAFELDGDESFFGMGESSGPFDRRGLIQRFWNVDVLGLGGIHPGLRNLYTSIPFTVWMTPRGPAGLFWDNPARQAWDLGQANPNQWTLTAASGEIDLYLFTGPTVADIVRRYSDLTGRMPMPPRWALGYHQCRYSYQSRAELEAVARQLRRRRIPCDAIYLDIHHMDGFRVFTFGPTFSKPGEMIARLRRRGFSTVAIVDPGVKVDSGFGVYRRGKQARAWVKAPDGRRDYVGAVWPGRAVFPDFLNHRVREWWGREQAKLQRLGVAGFWNDMNEPANFVPPTKTLPERCRHQGDFGPVRHAAGHNVYGMQMARASREGALRNKPDERPFVITRAAYAGTQRHAMVWTGDNASSWEHLADSVQMLLNLGLSGFPFCGGDAGGFLDNCTPELYARWMQMAAFTPFFRNHTMTGTRAHEPWTFGPGIEAIVREAIEWRYQLLPYWYCLFAEAHRTGTPLMRPLLWHHPADPIAVACGDQFLLGRDLMVAPVLRQGAVARSVYLPEGTWFEFRTGRRHRGNRHVVAEAALDRIPVFVRGGGILPMAALRQHTGGPPDTVIQLHLWPGGQGALDWYEDDGKSMEHTNAGFHRRTIHWDGTRLGFEASAGKTPSRVKTWRVVHRTARHRLKVEGVRTKRHSARETGLRSFEMNNKRTAFGATLR